MESAAASWRRLRSGLHVAETAPVLPPAWTCSTYGRSSITQGGAERGCFSTFCRDSPEIRPVGHDLPSHRRAVARIFDRNRPVGGQDDGHSACRAGTCSFPVLKAHSSCRGLSDL